MNEPRDNSPKREHRRILILTADAGFGHRSAANAVASALAELYGDQCDVSIVNPLEDKRVAFFLRDSGSDYDKMVRNMPELYRFGYDFSDSSLPAVIVEQALVVLLFEVMRDVVRANKPDAILSTYPLYQAPLRAVDIISRKSIPLLVTITDLATVHRLWFSNSIDQLMVPTSIVRDMAIGYGIAPEQIKISGIPVNPEVVREKRSPQEIRKSFGLQPDITTVLAVGSRRVDHLTSTLNVLNHFGRPLQLIMVAGRDVALYRQLKGMDWHVPYKLYEFSNQVTTLMKASDFIVCKAGGLIVTEGLACGKPLLLVDAIPGQETGNADYVVQNGAGELVRDPIEVLETLSHWLMNDGALLRRRAKAASELGRPNAAYEVAAALWTAAGWAPNPTGSERGASRTRLIDLLSRNHVPLEEDPASWRKN